MMDLRTLKSDQALRDIYLQRSVLETAKFPLLEFVPRRTTGLPAQLPVGTPIPNTTIVMPSALGFQLVGDMTLHGVTKEATWSVVSTTTADTVAGRATTTVLFSTFGLPKPVVPLLLSADDKIQIEVEFRGKRSAM